MFNSSCIVLPDVIKLSLSSAISDSLFVETAVFVDDLRFVNFVMQFDISPSILAFLCQIVQTLYTLSYFLRR